LELRVNTLSSHWVKDYLLSDESHCSMAQLRIAGRYLGVNLPRLMLLVVGVNLLWAASKSKLKRPPPSPLLALITLI
jgi:hypothetical protein